MATKWCPKDIGGELLEWAKRDDSINLNQYCWEFNVPYSAIISLRNNYDSFKDLFSIVKSAIAVRRETMLTEENLHVKSYTLNAFVYDQFMREEHMDRKEHEMKLKALLDDAEMQRKLVEKDQLIIELKAKLQELEYSGTLQPQTAR